jgi:hypothetical protein
MDSFVHQAYGHLLDVIALQSTRKNLVGANQCLVGFWPSLYSY